MIVKFTGSPEEKFLRNAEKLYAKALATRGEVPGIGMEQASIINIPGKGQGVYLDTDLYDGLTDSERKEMLKARVKELGGKIVTAFDANGNTVDFKIVTDKRFVNSKGKTVRANNDLATKFSGNKVKQEAVDLIDELVLTSTTSGTKDPAKHPHDWIDNNGKNDWEKWTANIVDKNNTVWEAELNIATSANGEKLLYDIDPIKKVGQAGTSATSSPISTLPQTKPVVNSQSGNSSQTGNQGNSPSVGRGFDEILGLEDTVPSFVRADINRIVNDPSISNEQKALDLINLFDSAKTPAEKSEIGRYIYMMKTRPADRKPFFGIRKAENSSAKENAKQNATYVPEEGIETSEGINLLDEEIETNIGSMPVKDYREILAVQNGFNSYEEMQAEARAMEEWDRKEEEWRKEQAEAQMKEIIREGRSRRFVREETKAEPGTSEFVSAEIGDSAKRVLEQMAPKTEKQSTTSQVNPKTESTNLVDVPQSEKSKRIERRYQRAVEEGVASVFGIDRSDIREDIRPILEEISAEVKDGNVSRKKAPLRVLSLFQKAFAIPFFKRLYSDYFTNCRRNIDNVRVFKIFFINFKIRFDKERNRHINRIGRSVSLIMAAVVRKNDYGIIFSKAGHYLFYYSKRVVCRFIIFLGAPADFVSDAVGGFKIEKNKIRFILTYEIFTVFLKHLRNFSAREMLF